MPVPYSIVTRLFIPGEAYGSQILEDVEMPVRQSTGTRILIPGEAVGSRPPENSIETRPFAPRTAIQPGPLENFGMPYPGRVRVEQALALGNVLIL